MYAGHADLTSLESRLISSRLLLVRGTSTVSLPRTIVAKRVAFFVGVCDMCNAFAVAYRSTRHVTPDLSCGQVGQR